jgi:hypothetical protein
MLQQMLFWRDRAAVSLMRYHTRPMSLCRMVLFFDFDNTLTSRDLIDDIYSSLGNLLLGRALKPDSFDLRTSPNCWRHLDVSSPASSAVGHDSSFAPSADWFLGHERLRRPSGIDALGRRLIGLRGEGSPREPRVTCMMFGRSVLC